MFGLKNKDGRVPPDIGKEDDEKIIGRVSGNKERSSKLRDTDSSHLVNPKSGVGSLEKVSVRLDSVVEWVKQLYDKFSYMNESIGEIRNMAMTNEKNISRAGVEADRVVSAVKDVKPEELRKDYQKLDLKIATLTEGLEANSQMMSELRKEMTDLQKKSEVFIGSESLMKLNEDTKRDLVEMQKLSSRVKLQADKSQEIFSEVRRGFAEAQKSQGMVSSLNELYSGIREEIEKLKLSHDKVVRQKDYEDFKTTYGNKLAVLDSLIPDVHMVKQNMEEFGDLIETSFSIGRTNKNDIAKIAISKGINDVKGIEEYENQIVDIVGIIEKLSRQVLDLRKKMGLKKSKKGAISVKKNDGKVSKGKAIKSGTKKRALTKKIKKEVIGKKVKKIIGKSVKKSSAIPKVISKKNKDEDSLLFSV